MGGAGAASSAVVRAEKAMTARARSALSLRVALVLALADVSHTLPLASAAEEARPGSSAPTPRVAYQPGQNTDEGEL
jgi:hypothetical protein